LCTRRHATDYTVSKFSCAGRRQDLAARPALRAAPFRIDKAAISRPICSRKHP
jgi:hypothetical protein